MSKEKLVMHGRNGDIQSRSEHSVKRKSIKLKEDIVIPKGTVFLYTPKSEQFASHQVLVDLDPDSVGTMVVWDELLELRPDLFEIVESE